MNVAPRPVVFQEEIEGIVARQTLRDGAMDFISKPFDVVRLQTTVDAALARRGRRTA